MPRHGPGGYTKSSIIMGIGSFSILDEYGFAQIISRKNLHSLQVLESHRELYRINQEQNLIKRVGRKIRGLFFLSHAVF
jgi:hypothetical protein